MRVKSNPKVCKLVAKQQPGIRGLPRVQLLPLIRSRRMQSDICRVAVLAKWHTIALMSCALGLVGCGNGLSSVDGTVTLDGAPLAGGAGVKASVGFYPDGQPGAAGIGILDSDGHYKLMVGSQEGIPPGKYTVAISATRIIMPKEPTGTPGGEPITPRKYADPRQSGFHADVQPGSNTVDFSLNSKSAK